MNFPKAFYKINLGYWDNLLYLAVVFLRMNHTKHPRDLRQIEFWDDVDHGFNRDAQPVGSSCSIQKTE